MVNKATCNKNPDKLTCVDLILANCPRSFQNFCVVEAELSDFDKMVATVMKTSYRKSQPKIIHYCNYKNFSNDIFNDILEIFIFSHYRKSLHKIWEAAVIRILMTFSYPAIRL